MCALTIQLIKRKGKPPLLRCVRKDGTETMSPSTVGAEHELAHFAVESTLRLKRGFYGQLAAGRQIQDYDVAGATTKIDIPDEGNATEYIVSLLQMERRNGTVYEDFQGELKRSVTSGRRPPREVPAFAAEQLGEIRSMLDELMSRWIGLGDGESIELDFEV